MKVIGDYDEGYALLQGLFPAEVCRAFLHRLKSDMDRAGISLDRFASSSPIVKKTSVDISDETYRPMVNFLWGLTPAISGVVGKRLLPTYNYFRLYQEGDVCLVHSDRESCEVSLTLTLAYSDGRPWPLDVGHARVEAQEPIKDDFGDDAFSSVEMQPGDAVLYQGVNRRHGRVSPNPNRWSAHMFLHWVDADGPNAALAFDQRNAPPDVIDFSF